MKRALAFTVIGFLTLALLLTGCGAQTNSDNAQTTDAPNQAKSPDTTATQPGTTSNQAGALTVGILTSVTGSYAAQGKQVEVAVKQAALDWKAKTGQDIKLIEEDDAGTVDGVKAAFTKLAAQKPAAIIGPDVSNLVDALGDNIAQAKLPVFSCRDSAVKSPEPWLMVTCTSDWTQLVTTYAVKDLGAKKPAVAVSNARLGQTIADQLSKLGAPAVVTADVSKDQDMINFLKTAKEQGADVIIAPLVTSVAAKLTVAAKQTVPSAMILGTGGFSGSDYTKLVGSAKDGINVATFSLLGVSNDFKSLEDNVHKNFPDAAITTYFGSYYDSAMMLFTAAQKATTTDPTQLRSAILGIKGYQGIIGTYTFDPTGHSIHRFVAAKWQGDNLSMVKALEAQ